MIEAIGQKIASPIPLQGNVQSKPLTQSFSEQLMSALDNVNELQLEADKLTQQLVTGEVEDIHQVLIASQKANLSVQLTLQVRNKVVEAYQEVMRMQI